jgi:hypothetical protein
MAAIALEETIRDLKPARGPFMEKSDLVAAVANTSALSMTEAANAVEFVLHVMCTDRHAAALETPSAANTNSPPRQQLRLFDETADARPG